MSELKNTVKKALSVVTGKKNCTFRRFRGVRTGEKDTLFAKSSVNCDQRGGVLTSGWGSYVCRDERLNTVVIATAEGPLYEGVPVKEVGYYRKKSGEGYTKELLILQENNVVSRYDLQTSWFVQIKEFSANSDMRMLDFVDKDRNFYKIFYGKDGVFSYNGNGFSKIYTGEAQAACVCKERLFLGIKPYTIAYSKVGDCDSFAQSADEGGKVFPISERGEIVEMQSLVDKVCIFMQKGLFCLKADGSARDFVLEEIPFGCGEALKNSVKAVKDKVYFLTEEGAHTFDGKQVFSAFEGMKLSPDKTGKVSSIVCGDRYAAKYTDKRKGVRTVALDIDGDGSEIFTSSMLCGTEGEVFTQNGLILYRVDKTGDLPAGEQCKFLSEEVDFGSTEEKAISKLVLEGEGNFTLTVRSNCGVRTVDVDLSDGEITLKPMIKGRAFAFEFILEKGAKIRKMSVEVELFKGVKGNGY